MNIVIQVQAAHRYVQRRINEDGFGHLRELCRRPWDLRFETDGALRTRREQIMHNGVGRVVEIPLNQAKVIGDVHKILSEAK